MRRFSITLLTLALLMGGLSAVAQVRFVSEEEAAPTPTPPKLQDVFDSVQQSTKRSSDLGPTLLLLVAVAALLGLLFWLSHMRQNQEQDQTRASPSRLVREVSKAAKLNANELHQLKQQADRLGVSNPLVLVLCPSLLPDIDDHDDDDDEEDDDA